MSKKIVKLSLLLLVIFFVFYGGYKIIKPKNILLNGQSGYMLQILDEEMKPAKLALPKKGTENENYNVLFKNGTNKIGDFVLTVYVNYEQVPFTVDNKEGNQYFFQLQPNEKKNITLNFPSKYLKYKENPLLINVVSGANMNASDLNKVTKFYGVTARYSINNINGSSKYPQPDSILKSVALKTNNQSKSFIINEHLSNPDNFNAPIAQINVEKNEKVALAFRGHGEAETKDFLLILNIDHSQLQFNKQPYWYFRLSESSHVFEKIDFKAPDKKGKYDIYGYLVQDPWTNIDHAYKIVLPMHRFTLNVN